MKNIEIPIENIVTGVSSEGSILLNRFDDCINHAFDHKMHLIARSTGLMAVNLSCPVNKNSARR